MPNDTYGDVVAGTMPVDPTGMSFGGAEMYSAGTGAVRSSDLKKERWDLMSGAALLQLKRAMGRIAPGDMTVQRLVEMAANNMWGALGGEASSAYPPAADVDRRMCLTNGWAYLAVAMEAEEGIVLPAAARYPFVALRRTAETCHEGAVKYGEENWHNGFRFKILCNHALKHMVRYTNGIIEDDELGHASWGFMSATHMLLCRPDMCDLLLGPKYTITDELRTYHAEHLSRKQVKNDPS